MRLFEDLWHIHENRDLLYADTISKNENHVYTDGNIIRCEVDKRFSGVADEAKKCDGLTLCPIIKLFRAPQSMDSTIKMKIIFK